MDGRQLDGDARPLIDAAPRRRLADGVDGVLIVGVVARGVLRRQGGLAQHVVGIAEALRLHRAGVGQRFLDGLAGDELLAHHAHGEIDAAPDQRLAAPRDQPRQGGGQRLLPARRGQLAGDQQAPGGGVDEHRAALAQMRLPVAPGDLVADQRVARGVVGDAQKRLRQTHQRHAFLAGQAVFVDQPLHAAPPRLGAQGGDQLAGGGRRRGNDAGGKGRLLEQEGQAFRFGPAVGGGDRRAQVGRRTDGRGEVGEGPGSAGTGGGGRSDGSGVDRAGHAVHRCRPLESAGRGRAGP